MRGEHWVILGLLSHWILMKIGIALESAGRIKEFSPKAWKNLRERRYKRVISVIRAAMSSIRTRRYPKNWIEVDTWNLCFFELVHDSFT